MVDLLKIFLFYNNNRGLQGEQWHYSDSIVVCYRVFYGTGASRQWLFSLENQ